MVGGFLVAFTMLAALSVPATAGRIDADASGYGGWNLGNVDVVLSGSGSVFDPATGTYSFSADSDFSYQSFVDNGMGTVTGVVLAKAYPIGEPPGIKIIQDDLAVREGRPTNCIIATSYLDGHLLDSVDPQQVPCSGPFQSHKRYKLAMLPSTVAGGPGNELGIDLVFDVSEEAGSRDYQVFQKINNWTDGRLEGFTIEVGTGLGDEFVPAADGVGVENLSVSVPGDVWRPNQLAMFSQGLFGPADTTHNRPPGFFDQSRRAGFTINEYPILSGETDTLTSGATLDSNYASSPPGAVDQFGPWLPNTMLPQGIFFDDDGNPETDAQLLAWYGYNPAIGDLGWMTGAAEGFAEISAEQIEAWGANLTYTMGPIDDLVNIGLNYIVTVGDVSSFGGSFTLRITPKADTSGAAPPPYQGAEPAPALTFAGSDGVVAIAPSPDYTVGVALTARVGDADLSAGPGALGEVTVTASSSTGLSETVTLIEQGEGRGVFAANLPSSFSDLPVGSEVTLTYVDADDGLGGTDVTKTVTTTAVADTTPAPTGSPVIEDFSVPASIFVNQTRKVTVTVQNEREADGAASGEVVVAANGTVVFRESFTDLEPKKRIRLPFTWTATTDADVNWTAAIVIGEETVDSATAFTDVSAKGGKKIGNN